MQNAKPCIVWLLFIPIENGVAQTNFLSEFRVWCLNRINCAGIYFTHAFVNSFIYVCHIRIISILFVWRKYSLSSIEILPFLYSFFALEIILAWALNAFAEFRVTLRSRCDIRLLFLLRPAQCHNHSARTANRNKSKKRVIGIIEGARKRKEESERQLM